MGTYLSTPVTDKCDESGQSLAANNNEAEKDKEKDHETDIPVEWGVVDMQGWRKSMEDAHTAVTNVPIGVGDDDDNVDDENTKKKKERHARVFGVYDGHGGPEVARFCQYYFVSVLTNQPSWVEHNTADSTNISTNTNTSTSSKKGIPMSEEDDRVPSPPPTPDELLFTSSTSSENSSSDEDDSHDEEFQRMRRYPYDGNGNEAGYRSKHLPQAMNTPVGKALREAFHAMDRMVNDPTRRHEIIALRNMKPDKGDTLQLEHGFQSIPPVINPASYPPPPEFYIQQQHGTSHVPSASESDTTATEADVLLQAKADEVAGEDDSSPETVIATVADVTAVLPGAGGDTYLSDEEKKTVETQQADKSLSTVLSEEQADAVRKEIQEFEKKQEQEQQDDKDTDSDVDSNDCVGFEEAAILDENIDDTDDEDEDGSAITPADAKTPPSPSSSFTAVAGGSDGAATADAAAASPTPPPQGGKVTTMLQKILSLGGDAGGAPVPSPEAAVTPLPIAADVVTAGVAPAIATATGTDNNNDNVNDGTGTGRTIINYPHSNEVTKTDPRYPSIIHNGRLVCNLPDHPIHAGATAVVACITGNILTVANAGDSRAVLCRRKLRQRTDADGDGDDDTTNVKNKNNSIIASDVYAYPLSYDHKPSETNELNRILNGGGFVNHFGRINGNLNLSRSIGDLKYKQVPGIPPEDQMITAEPDIMQIALSSSQDEFIVLGCDGIWDCLSNDEAVKFVYERIDTRTPVEIGTEMLDEIISDDPRITQGIGGDNMTIMIIDLQSSKRTRCQHKNVSTNTNTTATKDTVL